MPMKKKLVYTLLASVVFLCVVFIDDKIENASSSSETLDVFLAQAQIRQSSLGFDTHDRTAIQGETEQKESENDVATLKYYNYFVDHHTLLDNRVFTVNENTLQDDVIYFAFMNTEPIEGKADNIRTKKQIDDVMMKYFDIKPKRYNTGISSVTEDGDVYLGSVNEDIVRINRLLLKKHTDNDDGSCSAVFKLYQIEADGALPDYDRRILEGDPEVEMYYTMDVNATFTEISDGNSYYLKFSEFALTPREGPFVPPLQETDYSKKVSFNELKSYHGLSIAMTLDKAKELLNLPEGAYKYNEDEYADYTIVNVDGWIYTFMTLPKNEVCDKTQYLMSSNIRIIAM